MKMTIIECPACGAKLEPKNATHIYECKFCGSKIMPEKLFFDGNGNTDALIERAYLFLESMDFEKTLDINPHCSKAYIGKLLCQLRLRTLHDLVQAERFLTSYDYYNKAVKFASEEELCEYEQLSAAVLEKQNRKRADIEKEILDLQNQIAAQEKYLLENKNTYHKGIAKKYYGSYSSFFPCVRLLFGQ